MSRQDILRAIKERLQAAFGKRLVLVILYGSEARGEARPDSDIDIMAVLDRVEPGDRRTAIVALEPLQYAYQGRYIERWLVSKEVFEAQEFALYRDARREGIVA